jgi:hypothetical protein
MTVETLPVTQPETGYHGAGRIAEFRNVPALLDRPEDWVGSVPSRFELAPSGLPTLAGGRVLAEAIAADPRPLGRSAQPGADLSRRGVQLDLPNPTDSGLVADQCSTRPLIRNQARLRPVTKSVTKPACPNTSSRSEVQMSAAR